MIVDLFLVYSFIKRLTTPFDQWPAYRMGIIDADGNQLKKRKDLSRVDERDAFGIFDVVILKLKKLLAKIPGGQTKIASYAAAMWLIKEQSNFTETVEDSITEELLESEFGQYLQYTTEAYNVNRNFELMLEDGVGAIGGGAPANSAGSGNIAGIGIGKDGEPGVSKKAQKRIQNSGATSMLKCLMPPK